MINPDAAAMTGVATRKSAERDAQHQKPDRSLTGSPLPRISRRRLLDTAGRVDRSVTGFGRSFYWALLQALQEAHVKGWKDRMDAESLMKH